MLYFLPFQVNVLLPLRFQYLKASLNVTPPADLPCLYFSSPVFLYAVAFDLSVLSERPVASVFCALVLAFFAFSERTFAFLSIILDTSASVLPLYINFHRPAYLQTKDLTHL